MRAIIQSGTSWPVVDLVVSADVQSVKRALFIHLFALSVFCFHTHSDRPSVRGEELSTTEMVCG